MLASKAKTARAAESQNVSQNVVFVSRNPGGTGARARPSKNVSQAARAGCPADLGTSQNVSQAFVCVSQSLAWSRVLVWPLERPPRGSRVGGVGGGPGSNGSRGRPWCASGTRGAVGSQGRWMGWQPGVGGRVRAGGKVRTVEKGAQTVVWHDGVSLYTSLCAYLSTQGLHRIQVYTV